MKKIVAIDDIPGAIGPYSQAVWSGDFLYCSGQLGLDPETKQLAGDTVRAQAEQAMKNIRALLASQGLTPEHVLKTTVFLTSMADFKDVNEVYAKTFDKNPPARSCVAVAALPAGGLVEIEIIAHRG